MPWKEIGVLDKRVQFIAEVLDGEESMSTICETFEISRKTGYKWWMRYLQGGARALEDMSRRPHYHPKTTSQRTTEMILDLRRKHPTWGARKLKVRLKKLHPKTEWPAASTISKILNSSGLTAKRTKKRVTRFSEPLADVKRPNQVWCMDFKGTFDCGNSERCDTFTVTDAYSRFILYCQAVPNLNHEEVDKICDALMAEYGVPERIRTDNGTPFCSMSGFGVSRLSLKWAQLGIVHERIAPGRPTQNGRHERMHRTLKEDAATPPAKSLSAQKKRYEEFIKVFNYERPHEALGMKTPASVYSSRRKRTRRAEPKISYGKDYIVRGVRRNGTIRWKNREIFITEVLRGKNLGLRQTESQQVEVYFGRLHLGTIDDSLRFITKAS